jgi:WD40 repeat protein
VAYSRDGKHLASASWDETAKVWDAETGQEILTLKHADIVWSVAYSPDDRYIVTGSGGYGPNMERFTAEVKLWDAKTGKEIRTLNGHSGEVVSVAFSPDGKRIVSGSRDTTLKVWDAQTGQEIHTLRGHMNWVTGVAYRPDGKHIVSGSGDILGPGELKVWDAQTGQLLHTLKGHPGQILSVAYSPDGKWIVSGGTDNSLKIWDADQSMGNGR